MIVLVLSVLWWGHTYRASEFGYELWVEVPGPRDMHHTARYPRAYKLGPEVPPWGEEDMLLVECERCLARFSAPPELPGAVAAAQLRALHRCPQPVELPVDPDQG